MLIPNIKNNIPPDKLICFIEILSARYFPARTAKAEDTV